MLTLRKSIALTVLAAGTVAVVLQACSGDTSTPTNTATGNSKGDNHILAVPHLDEHDNHFYIAKTMSEKNFVEYTDPTISSVIHTTSWLGMSLAYFNDGSNTATNLSVNGKPYDAYSEGAQTYYDASEVTFHTDGAENLFSWTRNGVPYTDPWATNIGDVSITAPEFNSNVSRSGPLTITWAAPPGGGPATYARVTLSGKATDGGTTGTVTSFVDSDYIDNTGSYTITAAQLASVTENSARITVSVGTYKEENHGGESYLFVAYTNAVRDVNIVP